MKITINFSMFCDMFERSDRKDSFSYAGKQALFDYFEQIEQDTGEEIELDVIAICSDYSEYESLDDYNENNNTEYHSIEKLNNNTTVIKINDNSFIAMNI